MPESRGRARSKSRRGDDPVKPARSAGPLTNPPWFVPVMCALMIVGVVWVATFYISSGAFPVPIGYWNLAIGLGAIMAGFVMATRWR